MKDSDIFKNQGYLVIPGFIEPKDVARMSNRMRTLLKAGRLTQDSQCSKSFAIYGDPVHSEMLEKYRYRLEEHLNKKLFPTYPYSRIYQPRETLSYHSDRPACEISMTITLDFDTYTNLPWEIWVEVEGGRESYTAVESTKKIELKHGVPITLMPGDALCYKGCDISHWREEFKGISQTQVFLHYVDQAGPFAAYKYDFKPSLGSSIATKDQQKEQEENEKHGLSSRT